MIRVAVDAMGGDNAPQAEIAGALQALAEYPDFAVQLVGRPDAIEAELARTPASTARASGSCRRQTSSAWGEAARRGPPQAEFQYRRRARPPEGRARRRVRFRRQHRCGAGRLDPPARPPRKRRTRLGRHALSHGGRSGARARRRRQRGLLRARAPLLCHPRHRLHAGHPRAAESGGGTPQRGRGGREGKCRRQGGVPAPEGTAGPAFRGNIEGRDILAGHEKGGSLDVVVCDGFVGNVVLKFYESVARLILRLVKRRRRKCSIGTTSAPCSARSTTPSTAARRSWACAACRSSATAPRRPRHQERHPGGSAGRPGRPEPAHRRGDGPARAGTGMIQRPFAEIAGARRRGTEPVVTNADFEATLDTTDQWIVERTGIRERHYAGPDDSSPRWPRRGAAGHGAGRRHRGRSRLHRPRHRLA